MAKRINWDYKIMPYIMDCIDPEPYGVDCKDEIEKIKFLHDCFIKEHGYEIPRVGMQKAFENWIQGLPTVFNIKFYNYDILELAKKWGALPADPTEKQEDKILDNYWPLIAAKCIKLFNKFKLQEA